MGKKRKHGGGVHKSLGEVAELASDSDNSEFDGGDIYTDDIQDFHEQRNKVDAADLGIDSDGDSDEQEELFGMDGSESDEEMKEWQERLKQVKFQAKLDKKKSAAEPEYQERSWGKKRVDFYGSGVGKRNKTYDPEDEDDEWVMEAREIEKLQRKMDEDIDEEDFLVPGLIQKTPDKLDTKKSELKVKRDLSEKDKEKLQQQQHPEMKPLREELTKCVSQVEGLQGCRGWRTDSAEMVYRMYGAHIAFYLHLLETGADIRGHPVLARLLQWKKLAKVYDGFTAAMMEPSDDESDDDGGGGGRAEAHSGDEDEMTSAKKRRIMPADSDDDSEDDDMENIEGGDGGDDEDLTNRPITYEIEKNREHKKTKAKKNNPRTKNREKFRRAKIRRKGQVREYNVKLQASKYRGEVTGINKTKTRSTKFKHD